MITVDARPLETKDQAPAPRVNLLLVDDQPSNLLALEEVLKTLDVNVIKARSGVEALRCLLSEDFALILMDVKMPGMDGFETAALIRQRKRSQHTPIIFLTAYESDDLQMFKGYFRPPLFRWLVLMSPEHRIQRRPLAETTSITFRSRMGAWASPSAMLAVMGLGRRY